MDRTTGITVVAGVLAVAVVFTGATALGGTGILGTDPVGTATPGTDTGKTGPGETDPTGTDRRGTNPGGEAPPSTDGDESAASNGSRVAGLESFESSAAFAAYVQRSGGSGGFRGGQAGARGTPAATATPVATETAGGDGGDGGERVDAEPERASDDASSGGDDQRVADTNVQVEAVDEPDLVKADGDHFYYAATAARERWGEEPHVNREPATYVVDVSEPSAPQQVGRIETAGRQLIVDDSLVVLRNDELVGYDVSDPETPTREWSRHRNGSVVSARATNGQVYLVVRLGVRRSPECPVAPMDGAAVDCGDIYHPEDPVPVDGTYVVLSLDPATGEVSDSVGFVGSARHTAVYMDGDSLYVSYTDPFDRTEAYSGALLAADAVPTHVEERLREIRGYDLSSRAQWIEMQMTVERWLDTLNATERDRITDSLSRQVETYVANNARNFTTTGIVRVGIDDADGDGSGNDTGDGDGGGSGDGDGLSVEAHGTVPGRPLNQFSLNEHDGALRIATTIPGTNRDSENDLYTLHASNLSRRGSVQGMGEDQEIFAVRYVGDTAYLVTFRRVDPFHVVDLSDPGDPVEEGVLRLPGFSSYLHPVDGDHVLGIGQEDGLVKAVLFDVSNATNPTIADSKVFPRRWSRVSETHHAFLIDRRHGVFFMPAGEEGLVVDYANESLALEATVDVDGALRARYVGDYLYVFGEREIAVVDERTWNRTTTLRLD